MDFKIIIIIILAFISFLSLIIMGIIFHIKYRKKDEEWHKQFQNYKNSIYEIEKKNFKEQLDIEFLAYKTSIEDAKKESYQLDKEIAQKKQFNTTLMTMREEEIDRLTKEKLEKAELQIQIEVDEWAKSAQEAATANFELTAKYFNNLSEELNEKYQSLVAEVEEYRQKRDALNEEILRQRRMEEQQEFYRVQLNETTMHDLQVLHSIRSELSKIDNFDKFIYDIYVKKSVDEMIKRVLAGETPCGIYKITRLKTGEIYIGKSTDVKARWQQHAKSAYHCGTISHSILHTTIEKDGIENFTWELLEEVSKEELNAREKYWISFYNSTKYGLNEKVG